FTNGYAPDALCTPSRRSIQFGQNPIHTGNVLFKKNYDPKTNKWLTIPSLLKSIDPSYKTAHYGKWDLRADIYPEDLGYDESDGNTGNSNGDVMLDKKTKWSQTYINNDPKKTVTLTKRAINFMQRQVAAGNPFYLQVSYYATHVDIEAKDSTYQKYVKKPKGKKHNNPGWAGMLQDLDTGIGELLTMINKLRIDDNTYVFLMGDNGAVEFLPPVSNRLAPPSTFQNPMRNYPLRGGKWTLYEGGIRVPFMVKGPGIDSHSYSHVAVTGYDILPTISELAKNKKPLPAYLDGTSFCAAFTHPESAVMKRSEDALYFHRYASGYPHSAIIDGNYKLIKFWKTGKEELYDLSTDMGETKDLSTQSPEKFKELDTKLMAYLQKMHAEILDPALNEKKKNGKNKANDEEDD
ncbi:MAG: sulfatase-like hydrolase/transferase, partial [Bacteroidetes bacterium]|nr:sulfatase-like hydrolase/transferase [Bacteroidota bacterium]